MNWVAAVGGAIYFIRNMFHWDQRECLDPDLLLVVTTGMGGGPGIRLPLNYM